MAKPDLLFLLVKSMTKTEKRYFKLSSAKFASTDNKAYMRLFDAIDAQKEYDEAAIRKKFKNEPYFRHFVMAKIYLRKQIMKSMRGFHDSVSCDLRLNAYLSEIEILYNKGLLLNCADTVKKAKAYAEKYESLTYLLKIIDWEGKVAEYLTDSARADALRKDAIGEMKKTIRKYSEYTDLTQLYFEARSLFVNTGAGRDPAEAKKYKRIFGHPLTKKKSLSLSGEILRLSIDIYQAQYEGNFDRAYEALKNVLKVYDEHPHQIDEHLNPYFSTLVQLANIQIAIRKYKDATRAIRELKVLYNKKESELLVTNRLKFVYVEACLLTKQGEFKRALSMVPDMNDMLESCYEKINVVERLSVYHLCFYIHFGNKDFKSAQYYIQKVINEDDIIRADVQSSARIANLILQYEQREFRHLGYVLRSTSRYLQKKKRLYEPEVIVMDFINKALKFTSEKEMLPALKNFRKQILPYADKAFVDDISLVEWIDSKLQKQNFSELVQEKYQRAVREKKVETV